MLEKDIHPKINDLCDFYQRIESPMTGEGIPDSYIICDGIPAWAEVKYIKKWNGKIHHYTNLQRIWLLDNYKAGGNSILILGTLETIYYWQGKDCALIGLISKEEAIKKATTSLHEIIQRIKNERTL